VQTEKCSPETKPCFERNTARGYLVLKDKVGPNQLLLLPTAQVAGIDDPNLGSADAENLFARAWDARKWSSVLGAMDPDWISLALNSYAARSQDQLHIHIDCVDKDVRASLKKEWASIGIEWKPMSQRLKGHIYYARRVHDLDAESPLQLLRSLGMSREDMGRWTLVAVGAPGKGSGFILLADRLNGSDDWAWGEELQDHSCSR